jgi:hypothetical protein
VDAGFPIRTCANQRRHGAASTRHTFAKEVLPDLQKHLQEAEKLTRRPRVALTVTNP